ncbi:NahK/ErcS family hybrid sensor histidine kinase/response regulator [Tardiphaga sp.]|uniref:hybrid sensor histidine kinase/response regulator n=1 Tax=Tardiphaga sp. TaxID=1926292 RepID=UPI00352B9CB0
MSTRFEPDPRDAHILRLEAALAKSERINRVLMDRVERSTDLQGNAFSLFQTAITLEQKVRERTADLELALSRFAASNAQLSLAKEQADDAERRLHDAIASVNEGFALFDADERLVMFNDTYRGLWPDFTDRITPGVSFADTVRWFAEAGGTLGERRPPVHPVSGGGAADRIAEGGQVHILPDGRYLQVNELRTFEGGIVGIYTDITDVKAQDARLRAQELAAKTAILQATLDTIRLGVAVYDADHGLIASNDLLLPTIGLAADALTLVATHSGMIAAWPTTARKRAPSLDWLPTGAGDVTAQEQLADGRTIEVRRSAMNDGGMVMSFEDVTARLAAAEALRDANETLERRVDERTAALQREVAERLTAEAAMREAKTAAEDANISKTRFLAAASHDLLQPLNAARLFVSAIADRRLAAPTRVLVGQTGSALDSVEDLLEALLEISKLDAGAVVPQLGDFPLSDLLSALHAEFEPVARTRGLRLDIPPEPFWVHSDMRLARRILQNLVSNALRYTERGHVTLACRSRAGAIRIEVRDTGIGIAEEHYGVVFDEFRRLDHGSRQRGMGLGLAIVKRAADMLGTQVGLRSRPGEGSVFWITLPAAEPQESREPSSPRLQGRTIRHRAVLVIDNEEAILDGMAAMLGGWGYRIVTARDMPAALAAIDGGFVPDLVIADYHLDRGTGDVAVAAVRKRVSHDLPAIIITADRTPLLRAQLAEAGLACLTKPVKPAQLRATMNSPDR